MHEESVAGAGPGPSGAAPSGLPATLRRGRILDLVRERQFVRVRDLAEEFAISEVTVRQDLAALARRGDVRRVRGGAMSSREPVLERRFEESQVANREEKVAIGLAAAGLVSSGETVILDVGTTTTAVARALVARSDLHDVIVFTNGVNIALELEAMIPRATVVLTGGTLRPLQHSLVDPLSGLILERITADTAIIGCNGIEPDGSVTNVNLPESEVKRAMLRAARRKIIVADGSKLGRTALARICDTAELDLIITGASADAAIVAAIEQRGVRVLIAR